MVIYKDVEESKFELYADLELEKSAIEDETKPWIVKGFASVEIPDLDDEVLLVKGMDISFMENGGLMNWNHMKGAAYVIGEITKAQKILDKTPPRLYVEGELYKNQQEARNVYNLMKAIPESSSRKMKMSIEGSARHRVGKRIVKSIMRNVALTMQPINPLAFAMLAKGMCAHPEDEECIGCGKCVTKSVDVTSQLTGGKSPLVKEDLEGGDKATCTCGTKCKGGGSCNGGGVKLLTKAEAVSHLMSRKGYSGTTAGRVIDFIFRQGGN
jgi:hypothetical protein